MTRPASATRFDAAAIATSAGIVAGAFALSRVLGMVREIIIAARFGTGDTYDAYLAAFRIPDLLFVLVMSGAFGSAFIPVFGGFLAHDDAERAWRLANTLLTWVVVVFLVIAQLILLFAGPLVSRVIAPELPPASRELAVNLTRLLLLSPLLLGLGAAAKGMLEAHDAFTLPAIAPILYNLGIILGALALAPSFGAYGLAWGVIIGAAGHVAIQFVALHRRGLRLRPSLSRQTEGLSEVARLMGPRVAGQAIGQANLIVMTNFASRLGEGRISALSFANHLVMLPHGILAMSISTVVFPLLARQFGLNRPDEMRQTIQHVLGSMLFLTAPAAILLFAFRDSFVQVLFEYGSFTADSTELVAEAVGYFALGLLARSLLEPITRAFYAMHDTRTPLLFSILAVAANILLSWILADRMGHAGLALSLSITYSLRAMALFAILSRRTGGLGRTLLPSALRVLGAGAVLTLVLLLLAEPLREQTDPAGGRSPWGYAAFALALAGAGAIYLAAAWALRTPELFQIRQMVQRRFTRA